MTFDDETDEYVLASGRRVYAFSGSLGLQDGSDIVLYGSDGGFDTFDWTQAEREEVADEMIRRWTEWKQK